MKKLEGSHVAQYGLLWNYAIVVLEHNPSSTIQIMKEDGLFQRLYVCLDATKRSLRFCRPIISLDACFLKGAFGGQLHATVARDANNNMFAITYATFEVKLKDS